MNLGLRIKNARLEAGLSQRQLCGDVITRNMLSLIEHGSANPSMDTLQYLAGRLQKPVSYFLEEQAIISPNQSCMEKARTANPKQALEILQEYQPPDPVFDWEKYLLEALSLMELARQAIASGRMPYGFSLLEKAGKAGSQTPYYTQALERERLLLTARTGEANPVQLEKQLPDASDELLLRAESALKQQEFLRCIALLDSAPDRGSRWHRLRAEVFLQQKQYGEAASHLLLCEQTEDVLEKLEICYREQGDFQQAYYYACRRR